MAKELKIIIGADGAPLTKTLTELKHDLASFKKDIETARDPGLITNLNKKIAETEKNMKILRSAGLNAFSGLKPGANQAAAALTDVSRVAQDLPFGLVGIQNNLNPLIDSFARLKQESGSGREAFRLLAGSLIGPAGIGLAVAAVSTAFTIAQNGISGFNRKTKEAKDDLDEFLKSLKSTKQIHDEATGSVEDEITKVNALRDAILDVTSSNKDRQRALEDLKAINKDYFGDLTLEESALSKLTTATDNYTQALIAQATAKGFADEISKVSVEINKQKTILSDLQKEFDRVGKVTKEDILAASRYGAAYQDVQKIVDKGAIEDKLNAQKDVVENLESNMFGLKEGYKQALAEGRKFISLDSGGKTKKEVDFLKQRIDALKQIVELERQGLDKDVILVTDASLELKNLEIQLIKRDGKKDGFTEDEIKRLIFLRFPEFDGENLVLSKPLNIIASFKVQSVADTITKIDAAGDDLSEGITRMYDRIVKQGEKDGAKARKDLQKPANQLASAFESVVEGSFENVGESIADALSGDFNPAKAAVTLIGNALEQMGRAMIAFGVATKAFQELIKNSIFSNPFVAIGAGVAAIAVGKLLKQQLINSAPRLAEGGFATRPTIAMVGEAGPEVIAPLSKFRDMIGQGSGLIPELVETKVRGGDMYQVWKYHHARNNRLNP